MPILQTEEVSKDFGGVHALSGVSIDVEEGRIMGLIGPNGSGKSTLLNLIAGFYRPTRGRIRFRGSRIDGLPPHRIVRLGIAKTHQVPRPFLDMTVRENLAVSAMHGTLGSRNVAGGLEEADRILGYVDMGTRKNTLAGSLTVQEKKRLELGRALATGASVLLLDEVFSGLSPEELTGSIDLFSRLHRELKFTALVVEHVMKAVMSLSSQVVVLEEGRKIVEGSPSEVLHDEKVIKAYLGARSGAVRA